MSEGITDLTESGEGETSGKGKKKAKAPKPPKTANASKPMNAPLASKAGIGEIENGKKKKGLMKLLIILGAFLLIAGFVTASIVFNLFGFRDVVRDVLAGIVVSLDPDSSTIDDTFARANEARSAELDDREVLIATREALLVELDARLSGIEEQLNARETQLDRRSAELDRRGDQLAQREDRTVPLFQRNLTEQELEDIQSVSQTYTQMAPEAAAEILTELYNPNYVATILYFMRERNAAVILTEMETEFAAELTEILLTGQSGD